MGKRRKRARPAAPPPASPNAARSSRDARFPVLVLALFAVALALYWSGLHYPRVFDDTSVNPYTLKSDYAAALANPGLHRWLSMASFRTVNTLFGPDVSWQRLTNVLLHAATASLLFGFLTRLFGVVLEDARVQRLAFFGALWFLVHPVAVYGVAYLVQRSIVLATFFCVAMLWCVLEGLLRRSNRWHAAAIAAYALALLSKEHAVLAPAVAAALVVLVRGATRPIVRTTGILLGASAAVAALVIVQRGGVIGAAYEPFSAEILARLGVAPGDAYPLSILNQGALFFRYLLTWLVPWPGWISVDLHPAFPRELLTGPYIPASAAWLSYPVAAAWLLMRRGRLGLAGFALLWPWLLALTEFAAVRVQEPFVLYRSYLWMIGLPAALPALAAPLAPRWRAVVAAAVGLALIVAAHERLQTFATPLALWDDAVRKNTVPGAPYVQRAYISRAFAHLDAGRLDAAAPDIQRALQLAPDSPDAYLARGTLRLRSGDSAAALQDFARAIALDPAYASAYREQCIAKVQLQGTAQALPDCEKAVALDPLDSDGWINLGVVYRSLGRTADARASYERALSLRPEDSSAHYNYGVLLLDEGRRDEAVRRHFVLACKAGLGVACDLLRRSRYGDR